ncbi:NfeD family protein [Sphingomonas sp. R-74633]|uniref:NfeD family protein n=1 Tax=Sphingomonas sp. R-74633 TaxID=2751188 RepID=UPI0015D2D98B|nr:NfeD family protein [Sphingomonas sp. R-74633]NYT39853.1 NfeD family protein [Sphingomonas sp. R-74633]
MNLNELLAVPGLAWLILAALLAIAELLAPGIFLVFVAAGAAVTGIVTLLVPNFDMVFQVFLFAASSAGAVAVGRRWYRRNPVPSADPLLNDRVARLVGQVVTVVEPIASGQGRVKVGDGEWIANGPDAPAGAQVRITGARGGSLDVEPA